VEKLGRSDAKAPLKDARFVAPHWIGRFQHIISHACHKNTSRSNETLLLHTDKYHYLPTIIIMPFIPTNTKYVINGRVMGGTMRRKVAKRTKPWLLPLEAAAAAAGNPTLPPPQLEADDLPPAKKSRLQAPNGVSATFDGVTTEHTAEKGTTDETPTDDIPTDPVTPAASLASTVTSRAPRRNWNGEEDTKLTEAVKKHGKKWVAVATMVPGRTDKQCRQRWIYTLDPATAGKTTGRWNGEEDAKLIEAVEKYGKDWVVVATLVPGRTDKQCRARWTQALAPVAAGTTAGRWTPEEDAKLIDAVEKYAKNWVAVATLVPGRTDKQCRARWTQALASVAAGKTAGRWTPEEDAKLIDAVKKHGRDWVAVATIVLSRTDQQCRSRWTQTLDTAGKTAGPWNGEEDTLLTKAVEKHGKDWVAVAAMVLSRTAKQCRDRWTNTLDPSNGKNKGLGRQKQTKI
jgi:hypothetical protein